VCGRPALAGPPAPRRAPNSTNTPKTRLDLLDFFRRRTLSNDTDTVAYNSLLLAATTFAPVERLESSSWRRSSHAGADRPGGAILGETKQAGASTTSASPFSDMIGGVTAPPGPRE